MRENGLAEGAKAANLERSLSSLREVSGGSLSPSRSILYHIIIMREWHHHQRNWPSAVGKLERGRRDLGRGNNTPKYHCTTAHQSNDQTMNHYHMTHLLIARTRKGRTNNARYDEELSTPQARRAICGVCAPRSALTQ